MKPVDFGLHGRVALGTGASRGIGYGLGRAHAAAGAKVALAARTAAELDVLVAAIDADGGEALAVQTAGS